MRSVVKAAMLVVSSLLFVCPAWAGEVHVYTDREIRTALLELLNQAKQTIDVEMYVLTDESYCSFECLRQSLPHIAEAIKLFTREPRQVT